MWMLAADLKAKPVRFSARTGLCDGGKSSHLACLPAPRRFHPVFFFFLTAVDATSGGCVIFKAHRK